MSDDLKPKCFVIMPFGEKKGADGRDIDFDKIYHFLIKNTVQLAGLTCVRCDEIDEAGWIHAKMFQHIYDADVAVVDITSLNPNVFYELGVRHALADCVTVLIRRQGTTIPFNIQGFKIIDYDPLDLESIEEAKKKIGDFIRNGMKLGKKDSPVYEVLNLKIATEAKVLNKTVTFPYRLGHVQGKQICVITGDLQNVKNIDVWVNSENTSMLMARHHDRSISGVIRYLGAKKNAAGQVVDDIIAKELAGITGDPASVPPGHVMATSAGLLFASHGVKKIFHAASVVGMVGKGFTPIPDIGKCVRNALELANAPEFESAGLRSILFPLLGAGTGRGDLEGKASELIQTAIAYLEENPGCRIEHVYFIAWTDRELEACQRVLQEVPAVVAA